MRHIKQETINSKNTNTWAYLTWTTTNIWTEETIQKMIEIIKPVTEKISVNNTEWIWLFTILIILFLILIYNLWKSKQ